MILDSIENWRAYLGISPELDAALRFLGETSLELLEPGTEVALDGPSRLRDGEGAFNKARAG